MIIRITNISPNTKLLNYRGVSYNLNSFDSVAFTMDTDREFDYLVCLRNNPEFRLELVSDSYSPVDTIAHRKVITGRRCNEPPNILTENIINSQSEFSIEYLQSLDIDELLEIVSKLGLSTRLRTKSKIIDLIMSNTHS